MKHMTQPHHGQYDEETDYIYDAETGQWHPAPLFYERHGIPTYTTADTKMSGKQIALIVGIALVTLLVSIGLTLAFTSDDDKSKDPYTTSERSYINELKDAGVVVYAEANDDAYLLTTGYEVCALLDEGWGNEELAADAYATNDNGLSLQQARTIVNMAEVYLCSSIG